MLRCTPAGCRDGPVSRTCPRPAVRTGLFSRPTTGCAQVNYTERRPDRATSTRARRKTCCALQIWSAMLRDGGPAVLLVQLRFSGYAPRPICGRSRRFFEVSHRTGV